MRKKTQWDWKRGGGNETAREQKDGTCNSTTARIPTMDQEKSKGSLTLRGNVIGCTFSVVLIIHERSPPTRPPTHPPRPPPHTIFIPVTGNISLPIPLPANKQIAKEETKNKHQERQKEKKDRRNERRKEKRKKMTGEEKKKRERKNDRLNERRPEKKKRTVDGINRPSFPMKFLSFSCKKYFETEQGENYHTRELIIMPKTSHTHKQQKSETRSKHRKGSK